jgi:hypothetical protein
MGIECEVPPTHPCQRESHEQSRCLVERHPIRWVRCRNQDARNRVSQERDLSIQIRSRRGSSTADERVEQGGVFQRSHPAPLLRPQNSLIADCSFFRVSCVSISKNTAFSECGPSTQSVAINPWKKDRSCSADSRASRTNFALRSRSLRAEVIVLISRSMSVMDSWYGAPVMRQPSRSCAELPNRRQGEGPRIGRGRRWRAQLQGSVRRAFAVFRWTTGSEARTISRRAVSPILWLVRIGLGMRAISYRYISAALNKCQALRQFRRLMRRAITQS